MKQSLTFARRVPLVRACSAILAGALTLVAVVLADADSLENADVPPPAPGLA